MYVLHYIADTYAWIRWSRFTPLYTTWADFRRATRKCRMSGVAVYKRGWLSWIGN